MGHRYQHKFLKNDRGIDRLYRILSGQENSKDGNADITLPALGETIPYKGKTLVVTALSNGKIRMRIKDDPKSPIFSLPFKDWAPMAYGTSSRDLSKPNYIGFVSNYAKNGGPGENFAEMFAYYCMGDLPVLQSVAFEELVFGT
jgi:hypothetical protein